MLFTRSNKLCRFYLTTPYHRRANLLRIRPSTLRIYKTRKPSQLKNHKTLNARVLPSSQFSRAPAYKPLSQLPMTLITPVLIIILLIALQLGYITAVPNCLLNLLGENNPAEC